MDYRPGLGTRLCGQDRAFPTRYDLDAVAPENPVVLFAKSGHADWVNSRALEAAGITMSTPDPEGGKIVRDRAGEASGILLETAGDLVKAAVPDPTSAQLADMMADAQKEALACGITMIHDFDDPSCLVSLQLLREQGRLGLRALKHHQSELVGRGAGIGHPQRLRRRLDPLRRVETVCGRRLGAEDRAHV